MSHSHLPDDLQQLMSACAMQFGWRLLLRAEGGSLEFDELLDVARDLVVQEPDQAAFFLAGLVAQDILRVTASHDPGHSPSAN